MSFPTVPIRRVAKLGSGHTPSRQHPEYWENCSIPWLTLADVGMLRDGTVAVVESTVEKISELGVANSAASVHPRGTVALSRTASVGFTCIFGMDMATSQDFATWTCGPRILPKFLLYALRGNPEQIRLRMMGSTHKTIYMPDIETLVTPLPGLHVQRVVAAFLDAETARIDSLTGKYALLKALVIERRARFASDLLSSLPVVRLKRVASLLPGYTFASEEFSHGGPHERLLRGVNVGPGAVDIEDCVRLQEPAGQELERYRLREGDVVLGMDRPFVGGGTRVARVPGDAEGALLVQRVCRIRFSSKAQALLATTALAGPRFVEHVEHSLTGVSVPHLSEDQIGSFEVPMAVASDRDRILGALERSERWAGRMVSRCDETQTRLAERKQALITAAVTGQLDLACEIAEEAS